MVRQCASTAASVLLFGSSRMQSAPTSPCGWRSLKALKARISPSPKSWRRNDISQRYVLTISRNMYLYYLLLVFWCIYYVYIISTYVSWICSRTISPSGIQSTLHKLKQILCKWLTTTCGNLEASWVLTLQQPHERLLAIVIPVQGTMRQG